MTWDGARGGCDEDVRIRLALARRRRALREERLLRGPGARPPRGVDPERGGEAAPRAPRPAGRTPRLPRRPRPRPLDDRGDDRLPERSHPDPRGTRRPLRGADPGRGARSRVLALARRRDRAL